jgi:hypothetical protein
MALIKCKECGQEVSKKAKTCPGCGAPVKAQTSGCAWLFLIGIIFMVVVGGSGVFSGTGSSASSKPATPKTQEQIRLERIERGFSAWNGSHIALTRLVKDSMNDPKSFEHVETRYGDRGDYLIVNMQFRGKNAFGGTVLNYVKAKCSLDGQVLEIIEQGP